MLGLPVFFGFLLLAFVGATVSIVANSRKAFALLAGTFLLGLEHWKQSLCVFWHLIPTASLYCIHLRRTDPSALSTLLFLPIILAILVASDEATSNDTAVVWRSHSKKVLSSSTRNYLSVMPVGISRTLARRVERFSASFQ